MQTQARSRSVPEAEVRPARRTNLWRDSKISGVVLILVLLALWVRRGIARVEMRRAR